MTIPAAAVALNKPIDTIRTTLDVIEVEWRSQGIDTPVVDDAGDIDPDAWLELTDRL